MSNLEISRAERLDQYVLRQLPQLTRTYASRLISDGKVTVNGVVQTKPGIKPKTGDVVEIDYDPAIEAEIPRIELPIIYEDDDCVVIDKPVGLLTHSKGAFNPEATVASWLRLRIAGFVKEQTEDQSGNARAGIVHRLDRATSGVMICAKTPEAMTWLQKQFSQRRVKKTYRAILTGHLKHPQALIDLPIGRNPKAPATFRVDVNGKDARTTYEVLRETDHYSEVEFKPETGRTHQLRVHAAHLGHPIVGDHMYGKSGERMFLHAHQLELTLPNRERRVFEAAVPPAFVTLLDADDA